jgi:hypothetical protein
MKPTSQSDYTKRIERVIAAVAETLEHDRDLPSTAALVSASSWLIRNGSCARRRSCTNI